MKSGYNVTDGIYAEGSDDKLTADTLAKAIKDGKKIYTVAYGDGTKQVADKIATKGTDYAYVTKLYDKDGKEVSAQNIQDTKMQMALQQLLIITQQVQVLLALPQILQQI